MILIKMFGFVCKSIHSFCRTSEPHKLDILRLQQTSSFSTNANTSVSEYVSQYSFTVGHLMNEFGFSLEKVVVGSRRLNFENRDKPDAYVAFFKSQGFTHTQIRKLISANIDILRYSPETTLLPKIQFFRSKGISSIDLAKMINLNHHLLRRSLNHYIILPTFNSLKDLIGSDEGVILMLKGDFRVFTYAENRVKPNIEILGGAGVPYTRIAFLLKKRTRLFCFGPDKLKESIVEVQKMGIHPHRWNYVVALFVLTVLPRSKLNQKMKAYKRWGCSDYEVLKTFKIFPCIMTLSEEKINRVMSFCVNEIGWEPSEVVVKRYGLLALSLNKRIMPRWAVYQNLVSKRLVKEEFELTSMFKMRVDLFLEKYVNCYTNDAPMLLKVYIEKIEVAR